MNRGFQIPFRSTALRSRIEFDIYREAMRPILDRRYGRELTLATKAKEFRLGGVCAVCKCATSFSVTTTDGEKLPDGLILPNWGEQLRCGCGLISRDRATLHFLQSVTQRDYPPLLFLGPRSFLSEHLQARVSNFVHWKMEEGASARLKGAHSCVLSSEGLDGVPLFEDLVSEVVRVLEPGAPFIFTVPFHSMRDEVTQTAGRYTFGWDLLDVLRDGGFKDVAAHTYWSEELGYYGANNFLFCATKGG